MKLSEIADHLIAHAARCYGQGDEYIYPMIHAENDAGQAMFITTPWTNDEEKSNALEAIRILFRDNAVVRYGIITEAWMAWYGPKEVPKDGSWPITKPRERKDRIEVLNIVTADIDGNQCNRSYKIDRNGNGIPSVGGMLPLEDGFQMGRLTELLPQKGNTSCSPSSGLH